MLLSVDIKYQKHRFANSTMGVGCKKILSDSRQRRDSNFEILRIIAMMMVILQHIAVYGGWPMDINQTFDLGVNSFFIQFIYHFGKIGVWIFVLITGYFMISSKSSVVPKYLKLWLQVLMTSLVIDLAFIIFGNVSVDSIEWKTDLFPIISGDWWFASTYLIVLPFTPFVNRILITLNRREHLTLIIMMLIAWSIIPTFTHSSMYGSFVMMFLVMYTIGAYIRLHPKSFEKSAKHYGLFTLLSLMLLALLIALIQIIGPINGFKPFESALSWGNEKSVMVVLISILTFLTFKQINVGHIHWVNTVAMTTFGIYLIHEHDLFRQWMFESLNMGPRFYSPDLVPYTVLCMLTIFVGCATLEFIRIQTIERGTSKMIPGLTRATYWVQARLVGED